jgi:hypothetical protein
VAPSTPNFDALFDADEYYAAGRLPWSITGYDAQFADPDGRPSDPELLAFLALLQANGVRFGIWRADFFRPGHRWVVAPIESMPQVVSVINRLEVSGAIPKGLCSELSRRLTALSPASTD